MGGRGWMVWDVLRGTEVRRWTAWDALCGTATRDGHIETDFTWDGRKRDGFSWNAYSTIDVYTRSTFW